NRRIARPAPRSSGRSLAAVREDGPREMAVTAFGRHQNPAYGDQALPSPAALAAGAETSQAEAADHLGEVVHVLRVLLRRRGHLLGAGRVALRDLVEPRDVVADLLDRLGLVLGRAVD